jgi:hypothetical protein
LPIQCAFEWNTQAIFKHPKTQAKMKRLKFLSTMAALGIAMSAYSLTIIPTFDGSITNDPNGAAMVSGINFAIATLQSNILDNVTVKIAFTNDDSVGLGQSQTFGGEYGYTNFLAALKRRAASVNDTNALSKLPNSATDPVIGGTKIHLTTAQARVLGIDSYSGLDSTISLKMSLMNFSRPLADPNKYDLISTVEHEVDEVLGISSGLPDTSFVWPVDLFRYTTNLARTFTGTGADNAYFSVDGTNLVARYNMDPSGDFGDWWSINGTNRFAPPGTTPRAQVQDAFGNPGLAQDLGVSELTALDVVGWTVASTTPQSPPLLTLVRNGANQFTLLWTNTATGFTLQERTNLASGSWVASATGTTNPAVITSAGTQKFYRLFKNATPGIVQANPAVFRQTTPVTHNVVTRVFQPRNP